MATRIIPDALRGLLIPSALATWALVGANTGTTSTSLWNASGPHPGSPVLTDALSEFRAELSGEQSSDLRVVQMNAGLPGLRQGGIGARIAYRAEADTGVDGKTAVAGDGDYRGWEPPNVITGYTGIFALAASATYTFGGAAVIPSTQQLIVVYTQLTGGSSTQSALYTHATDTWTTGGLVPHPLNGANRSIATFVIPTSERVVAVIVDNNDQTVQYSDDKGTTWGVYSVNPFRSSVAGTALRTRAHYMPNGDVGYVMMLSTGNLSIHASRDIGASFTLVKTWAFGGSKNHDVIALQSGRLMYVSINAATSFIETRTVGSVWDDPSTLTAVSVDVTTTWADVTGYQDADGTIYVIGRISSGSNDSLYLFKSEDEGVTWKKYPHGIYKSEDAATYPTSLFAVGAHGRGNLFHQNVAAPGTLDLSVCVLQLGGWSNCVLDENYESTETDPDVRRISPGPSTLTTTGRAQWLPYDLPADTGAIWTETVGAVIALTSSGDMTVTSTAGQRYWTLTAGLGTGMGAVVEVRGYACTSGGSLTATQAGWEVRTANGTQDYAIYIRWDTTGFRIYDANAAATLATITLATSTTIRADVRVCLRYTTSFARVEVFYKVTGTSKWIMGYQGAPTIAGAPAATGTFRWGNVATGTAVSRWRYVSVVASTPTTTKGSIWKSRLSSYVVGATSSVHYGILGKLASGTAYPLYDNATAGATFVTGRGVARFGDYQKFPVSYDYGPETLFQEISPSPDEQWRSSDETEQYYTWSFASTRANWLGNYSIGVAFLNTNFRTAYLEYWDGAAWQIAGTYDAATDFSALRFNRSGDMITPATGGASTFGRYLHAEEAVGAVMELSATKFRRIAEHTPGTWDTVNTTARPTIRLEGTDGSEPASGTTGKIYARNGVLIVHKVETHYTRWRVRIPAQTTPDGQFRGGVMLLGGVHAFGRQWSKGWSMDAEPNATITEDTRGTTRVEENGRVVRQWSVAWPDTVRQKGLQQAATTAPDYLAPDGAGKPLVARNDVPWALVGMLQKVQSGKIPVVLLRSFPDATSSSTCVITDPTLFLYCRLMNAVRIEHVEGTEEKSGARSGEVYRVGTLIFREIV